MKNLVETQCKLCGTWERALVDVTAYQHYLNGALVQDVFPDLPEDDREVIIGARTGFFVCPECWWCQPEE